MTKNLRTVKRPSRYSRAQIDLQTTCRRPVLCSRTGGHGVAVLLKIYAHCIDGQATAANQRIAEALGTRDTEQDLGDEGDGDMEQAS